MFNEPHHTILTVLHAVAGLCGIVLSHEIGLKSISERRPHKEIYRKVQECNGAKMIDFHRLIERTYTDTKPFVKIIGQPTDICHQITSVLLLGSVITIIMKLQPHRRGK